MQSQAEELTSDLSVLTAQKRKPGNLALYEEYSQTEIAETIRTRRFKYENAAPNRRRELEEGVETEIDTFRKWLEETKNLNPNAAHYYAISLKSLLLGVPIGVQIAELFSTLLSNLPDNEADE